MEAKNPYKRNGMFEGALHSVFENAKKNRDNPTIAETVLWMHLRAGISGHKFRRQHPIGMYIADFYCHRAKLIIEVDGTVHQQAEVIKTDMEKESFLKHNGYHVTRFTNEEILNKIEGVIERITALVKNNFHKQSPDIGG